MDCFKAQLSSKNAPKKEFLPALAKVVEVVSKILPPTLNRILSFGSFMLEFYGEFEGVFEQREQRKGDKESETMTEGAKNSVGRISKEKENQINFPES